MTRFYIRWLFIPLIVFSIALWLIRLQPDDEHELRQLLLPEGCPAPCFLGIRPGVTTYDEAIQLLVASKWVEIDPSKLNGDDITYPLILHWNGQQSPLLNATEGLNLTFQYTKPRTVARISFLLEPHVHLGDVYGVLGKPSRLTQPSILVRLGTDQPLLVVSHQYDEHLINLLTISDCPMDTLRFFNQPLAAIEYNSQVQSAFQEVSLKDILRYPNCG